ncbi:MAG: hypothetical protein KY475_16925, partial [Planctomycetes bacterium]|nr:hypothetical protein [Planctomycetota bacterium]
MILAAGANPSIDLEGEEAVDIYLCDFSRQTLRGEDREADINYDTWPDHWTRRRDAEHPAFVKIAIAGDQPVNDAAPGASQRWLQIELDGGAAAALSPTLDVSPRFTYLVECRVRAAGLKHNEVYCSVSFFDEDHQLLEQHDSPRRRDAGDWRDLRISPFTPQNPAVRHAVIGLHVVPTGKEDLTGTVMFDDVRLARLPRMALTANSPHHVYTEPSSILLTCDVSGVREPTPELHLRLFDVFGRMVDDERRQMAGELIERHASGAAAAHTQTYAGALEWKPKIREPGFYRAQARMRTQQGVIHLRSLTFVVIRPTPHRDLSRGPQGGQFGWSLPRGEEVLPLEAMASLTGYAGVQWVKLPAWFDAQDQNYADRLVRFVDRVEQDGVTVVGVLDEPPASARPLFGNDRSLPIAS